MTDVVDLSGDSEQGVSSLGNASPDDGGAGGANGRHHALSAALRALYIRHVVPRRECENLRDPLTDEQNQKWNEATTSETDSDVLVYNSGKDYMSITVKDAKTLKPKTWLNDAVIDFALDDIAKRAKNVCALRTQFIRKLYKDTGTYVYDSVKSWTTQERLGYDILCCDKILIPVNQNENHWVLVIVYPSSKKIVYYDPLGNRDETCTGNITNWIRDEYREKKKDLEKKNWTVQYVSEPRQHNGYDCGVFLCTYAKYVALGCEINFSQSDMEYFRKRILIDVLEGSR